MALTEKTVIDQITILEDGLIQVRRVRRVFDDGELLAERFHRSVLEPGQDVTALPQRLQTICGAVWTQKVIDDYKAAKAARQL